MKLSNNKIFDCSFVEIGKAHNKSGNITVVENSKNIPFNVERVYYLYDVPCGEKRGGHAHYELEQYIIAASGSFDVVIDDGVNKKRISLNNPNQAIHIVPGLWRELDNFSSGSICLVLASQKYKEEDYIRDYEFFFNEKNNDTSIS